MTLFDAEWTDAELRAEREDDAGPVDQPATCCDAARIYGGDCAHTIDWEYEAARSAEAVPA